ncbi:hypothetical protein CAP35_08045 [Chitinophagaceae bacterium IBVUCB1]|nr:hypothetical protein CAP35_08045 [Chitinophagaceae bacterium IBVUCB1]
MLKKIAFLTFFLLCGVSVYAQLQQNIRGVVYDKESKTPLVGVVVSLNEKGSTIGTVTDEQGGYILMNVPVGKVSVAYNYVGYQQVVLSNILVTSAKEVLLNIEMEESATKMQEVEVKAKKEYINEMALVSAKTFDVQETERYAGSRADPARMASNFAGVHGADDSRNDIIIRGNSPQGILWRLEDVDIPNPNHFAIPGTTGGPVSMLNNKTLANSDFFTGAFPAEYGNSTAGVFDLKMRNGNNKRHEITGQLGFLGTELAAEGPLSKKSGASYLFTYRYSTLKLFEGLNIKIGTNSIPNYQDAALKLNLPIGKKTNISVFGIGGLSKIDLIVSKLTEQPEELYGESDRDQYFSSNTGVGGVSFHHLIDKNTYTKAVIVQSVNDITSRHDKVFRDANYMVDSLKHVLGYRFNIQTTTAHWFVNKKLSARSVVKAGIINNYYRVIMTDSSRQFPVSRQDWQHRLDYEGRTALLQLYAQYKYRPSNALTFTGGLHGQYLTHTSEFVIEPRLGMRWRTSDKSVVTAGYGLHSQMQPLYQYFAHLPTAASTDMHNYDLGFTRSHHAVAGYEYVFSKVLRLRSEVYYQYLFNVPIETLAGSSFSGLNQGASFSRLFPNKLVNNGTGYNYGLELTIEKFFHRNFYMLATGSVFDSKARGNDGVYRNTDYNTKFATNLLAGYEPKLGKNSVLLTGVKITYAGGRLYSPPDVAASNATGDLVIVETQRNTLKFPDYFRADMRLGIRINARRFTHEIAADLVNVFAIRNVLSISYNADLAAQGAYPFVKNYQLGFLPLFYYRIDFGSGKK